MITEISKSGSRVSIKEGGADPKFFTQGEITEYGFNGDNSLEIEVTNGGAKRVLSIELSDLRIQGVTPSGKEDAITKLSAVFHNAGAATVPTIVTANATEFIYTATETDTTLVLCGAEGPVDTPTFSDDLTKIEGGSSIKS